MPIAHSTSLEEDCVAQTNVTCGLPVSRVRRQAGARTPGATIDQEDPARNTRGRALESPFRLSPFLVNDRFENINLLRAFAATAVVVYHVIEFMKWKAFPFEGPLLTFRIGWIGVDLFFVISGFVITRSALALWRQDPIEFGRQYWARRLSRIVPLYVLTGALWILLFKPGFFDLPPTRWLWQLATHLTFTHTFWPGTYDSIDGVNWTRALEMQFYFGVALLVP